MDPDLGRFPVVWAAATITFFIPHISTRNPIRERFNELARTGGFSPGDMEKIIASCAGTASRP